MGAKSKEKWWGAPEQHTPETCKFCGGDSSKRVACCPNMRVERRRAAVARAKQTKTDFAKYQQETIYKEVKINKVLCKDCKKPTSGTYRCEECKAKWAKRNGITLQTNINEEWAQYA